MIDGWGGSGVSVATQPSRRVLMLAFQYPPMKGSSGLQRTLNFTRYLPELGWDPRLLTVWPGAYPSVSPEQLNDIPRGMRVRRLPCIDVARHLSLRGRYPGFLSPSVPRLCPPQKHLYLRRFSHFRSVPESQFHAFSSHSRCSGSTNPPNSPPTSNKCIFTFVRTWFSATSSSR